MNIYTHEYNEINLINSINKIKIHLEKKNYIKNNINFYIFGDSHTKCFIRKNISIYNNININNCYMSSSSLTGFNKKISRLNYRKKINKMISSNSNNYYIFKFGQVDFEYVYYYKIYVLKQEIDINIFINNLINNYIDIINEYKKINKNILICGLNICNYDNYLKDIKEHLKMEIIVNENDVNTNILLFNDTLKNMCEKNNILYFDLIKETTYFEKNNIKIKHDYIGFDYHYRGAECQDVYEKNINKLPDTNNTNIIFLTKLFETLNLI